MTYVIKEIDLNRIYLDNYNPRHDPIENEPEIIRHLIANEQVKPLARHIANAGHTSPLERMAVVAHPEVTNAFIAAEGNRRLCAVKLLADPDKADTEVNRKYFRELASKMENLQVKLEVVIFKDMHAARPWISLRHEGVQGGVGIKAWNPAQQARFNANGSGNHNPNIQSYLLKEYARDNGLLPPDKIDVLSITTLTRYLSNPFFRDMLGLADNKTLRITVPAEEFNPAVMRFLSDTLDPDTKVNSRTSADDRKAYAARLRTENVAPTTRDLPPVDIKAAQPTGSASPASINTSPRRNNRSPDNRLNVIPNTFKANIKNKILKRLYDELRNLNTNEFPFAASYLLRAVIEQIATLFLKQNGAPIDRELHKKLGRVAEVLSTKGVTDRELKVLRTMCNDKDSRHSPETIGNFVHGGAVPTRTDVIKTWDSLESILSQILPQLK